MSIVKDLFDKLNYVSERKERDNIVSNEFKNVIVDVLILTTKAVEKGIIKAQDALDSASFIPRNMRAFAHEHVANVLTEINAYTKKINDLKLYETIDNEYQPNVSGKVKGRMAA